MTRTMYDSVNPNHLPVGGDLYAGYINGRYKNVDAIRARFPDKTVVTISVRARYDEGHVLDVETGDATPEEAPGWVVKRRSAGVDPTVYCIVSAWNQVRSAFQTQRVAEPHYWIAHYDNNPAIPAGAVAKQYGGDRPGNYDISSVAAHWPGVDREDDMTPEQDQRLKDIEATLADVKNMLDVISNGAPQFGLLPTTTAVTEIHRKLIP